MCIVVLSCRCKLYFYSFFICCFATAPLFKRYNGPQIFKIGLRDPNTTATSESTCGRYAESSVLYLCTKFEADTSIRSIVLRVPNIEIGSRVFGYAHLGSVCVPCDGTSMLYLCTILESLVWFVRLKNEKLRTEKYPISIFWRPNILKLGHGTINAFLLNNLKRWVFVEIRLRTLNANCFASSLMRCWVMEESNVNGPSSILPLKYPVHIAFINYSQRIKLQKHNIWQ